MSQLLSKEENKGFLIKNDSVYSLDREFSKDDFSLYSPCEPNEKCQLLSIKAKNETDLEIGASVYLNGYKLGSTPFSNKIRPGIYVLKVISTFGDFFSAVEIKDGRDTEFNLVLRNLPPAFNSVFYFIIPKPDASALKVKGIQFERTQ